MAEHEEEDLGLRGPEASHSRTDTHKRKGQRMKCGSPGYTLMEVLIVAAVLIISAAIVIPQQALASKDARQLALRSDLEAIRSRLQLYKAEHEESFRAAGTFVAQFTSRTDSTGAVMPPGGDTTKYPFGPYLLTFPSNMFISDPALANTVTTGASACPGDGTSGWYFNTSTGTLSPNDAAHREL